MVCKTRTHLQLTGHKGQLYLKVNCIHAWDSRVWAASTGVREGRDNLHLKGAELRRCRAKRGPAKQRTDEGTEVFATAIREKSGDGF